MFQCYFLNSTQPLLLPLCSKVCSCVCVCRGVLAAAAAKSLQSCLTLRPHRQQPTRAPPAPRPWDSPGKTTGVGSQFRLQCMKVKSESEVSQSCLTLCSLPGPFICGIFQARVLESGAIAFSEVFLRKLNISLWET